MNKEDVLKIVIGVGAGFAAFSIASALYSNYKKKKDEEATIDALVKTEAIGSGASFSGANGFNKPPRPKVYKCKDVKGAIYYSKTPCPRGGETTPPPVVNCDTLLVSISNIKQRLNSLYNLPDSEPLKITLIQKAKALLEQYQAQHTKLGCGGTRRYITRGGDIYDGQAACTRHNSNTTCSEL